MWFGIMVGLALWGTSMTFANQDRPWLDAHTRVLRTYMRIVSYLAVSVGACGAAAWLVEVLWLS